MIFRFQIPLQLLVSILIHSGCLPWRDELQHSVFAQPTAGLEERPNIVLIMADDLGWKDLACYGNEYVDTPHLDRLAEQGVLFTDAYAAAPVCTPTRAALLTGEAPARLGITNHAPGHTLGFVKAGTKLQTPDWNRHLPLERITLAEQLQAAGYATGFVGKWHLSYDAEGVARHEANLRPERQGFQMNAGGCQLGGPPSYFAPFKIPTLREASAGAYLPDYCASKCVQFMEANPSRPFFLCWWNYSVHYPFEAPQQLIRKYEQLGLPRQHNPTYLAMIEGMDRSIGRVLRALDELPGNRPSLLIFTSDNGPFAADVRPLRGEKGYLYEGGIRVPLIIRWPAAPSRSCSTPVITMDLHATILDASGVASDASNVQDGVTLLGLLRGLDVDDRALYFHYPNYAFHKQNRMGSAIRQGRWKLLQYPDPNVKDRFARELYDLQDDLSESNDLSAVKPTLADRLSRKLTDWLASTDARLPGYAPEPAPMK